MKEMQNLGSAKSLIKSKLKENGIRYRISSISHPALKHTNTVDP